MTQRMDYNAAAPAGVKALGGVYGHRVHPLGVEHFGQTGTVAELYRHFGIDAASIRSAAGPAIPTSATGSATRPAARSISASRRGRSSRSSER